MKLLINIGFILTIIIPLTIADRKLTAEFNPGCTRKDNCSSVSKLAYVRAEGDNDTVHFIFDFSSNRKPSLVLLTTAKDAVIHINYEESDVDNTIKFSKTPMYTFASVFNKLYEFNDVNDTAKIENDEQFTTMDLKLYDWNMTEINQYNESVEITISPLKMYRAAGISKNGTVSITLRVHGKNGIGSILPHIVHTPESGELTLTLDKLQTNFKNSRFAVELLTFSSPPFNKYEDLLFDSFSDDKSSGGTFLNYFVEAKDDNEESGGYLSWKPVVYKAPNTHPLNSSSTFQYSIQDHIYESDWINSPLFKLFGNTLFHSKLNLMKAINVSFGEPGDEFYAKSNYLYWTFLVGIGAPLNSNLEGFLELSIIASLLLMLTITMILIFCIFMRWVSSKRNSIIYGQ